MSYDTMSQANLVDIIPSVPGEFEKLQAEWAARRFNRRFYACLGLFNTVAALLIIAGFSITHPQSLFYFAACLVCAWFLGMKTVTFPREWSGRRASDSGRGY